MSIGFYEEEIKLPELDYQNINRWLKGVLRSYKKRLGTINYIFCNDEYLLDINVKFLNHNYLTDIITFDYVEENIISGDLYISVDRIKENCQMFNCSEQEEFLRVIVHGLLHLLGYQDHSETERDEMRKLEDRMISKFSNYR